MHNSTTFYDKRNHRLKRLALILSLIPALLLAGTQNLPQARVLLCPTTPVNGTSEVQTITIGGTPTSGTFRLKFNNRATTNITWSSTNGTLVANIDSALEGLANIGTTGVTTAVASMTAGIGTITVTFAGHNAKNDVSEMTVDNNSLAGSSPTVAVTTTTPGVVADGRTSTTGTLCVAADSGNLYVNLGASPNPNWTSIATP